MIKLNAIGHSKQFITKQCLISIKMAFVVMKNMHNPLLKIFITNYV